MRPTPRRPRPGAISPCRRSTRHSTRPAPDYLAAIAALTDADLAAPCGLPYDAEYSLLQILEGTVAHNAEHAEELAAWRSSVSRET